MSYFCNDGIEECEERIVLALCDALSESFPARASNAIGLRLEEKFRVKLQPVINWALRETTAVIKKVVYDEREDAYDNGVAAGREKGETDGYEQGYESGFEAGRDEKNEENRPQCPQCTTARLTLNAVAGIYLCDRCRREFTLQETQYVNR